MELSCDAEPFFAVVDDDLPHFDPSKSPQSSLTSTGSISPNWADSPAVDCWDELLPPADTIVFSLDWPNFGTPAEVESPSPPPRRSARGRQASRRLEFDGDATPLPPPRVVVPKSLRPPKVAGSVDDLGANELLAHFEPKLQKGMSNEWRARHRYRQSHGGIRLRPLPQLIAAIWRLVHTRIQNGEILPARIMTNNSVCVTIRVSRPVDFLARLDMELHGPGDARGDTALTYKLFLRQVRTWFKADYPDRVHATTPPFNMLLVNDKNRRQRWHCAEVLGARCVPW